MRLVKLNKDGTVRKEIFTGLKRKPDVNGFDAVMLDKHDMQKLEKLRKQMGANGALDYLLGVL